MRLGVAHQTRGVHERQTDPLTVVGELLAVEIGPEVALVDRDARSAGQGVHPVAQVLDDEVAHRPGPIVELERGRHERAAAGQARRLLPGEPALEQGAHARLTARNRERRLDDALDHAGAAMRRISSCSASFERKWAKRPLLDIRRSSASRPIVSPSKPIRVASPSA